MAGSGNWLHQLKNTRSNLRPINRWLLIIVAILSIFGLVMLSGISSVIAYDLHHDAYYFFKRQIIFSIVGWGLFWIGSRIPYQVWKKFALPALIISLVLLITLFIPGLSKTVNGSRSWITIMGLPGFQPTEIIKLLFIIYLSAWFANHRLSANDPDQSTKILPFLIIYGLIAFLILMQPDLGTLIILSGAAFVVFFISGVKIRYLGVICLIALVALAGLVSFSKHQQERFKCVINPDYSPMAACYQVNQSLIAIGSGGIFGRGIGNSRQKYLNLPEVHNDFIFAIIAEEIGLIFSLLVIALYFVLFYKGFLIAKNSTDDFAKNMATGITAWIAIQTILNIGGITNLLPMTGIPLPLISYGGSSLISCFFALGILANISRQQG